MSGSTNNETFHEFGKRLGLSSQMMKSISRLCYTYPLPIQHASLSLLLEEGKDVVLNSRTGSGKTVAYMVPMLEKVLRSGSAVSGTQLCVVLPTIDLVHQTAAVCRELSYFAEDAVGQPVCLLKAKTQSDGAVTRSQLMDSPKILIGTCGGYLEVRTIATRFDAASYLPAYSYDIYIYIYIYISLSLS